VSAAGPAAGAPAHATFAGSTSVTTGVQTLVVEPPTRVEAWLASCLPSEGTVVVEWQLSGSRGVSGYVVTMTLSDGSVSDVARVGPTSDEARFTLDVRTTKQSPRFTVTTLTSYGWTAKSADFEGPKC
jgi:hypothetical protein